MRVIQNKLLLISLVLTLLLCSNAFAWVQANGIRVKMDYDNPELWEFRFINGFQHLDLTEEDGFIGGDDDCTYTVHTDVILQQDGRLSDVWRGGRSGPGCGGGGNGPDDILNRQWQPPYVTSNHCGDCSLSNGGTVYQLRGDIYIDPNGWMTLCDSSEHNHVLTTSTGRWLRCTSSNDFIEEFIPPNPTEICNDGIDNEIPPDGLVDCADPDCSPGDVCDASGGVCCGGTCAGNNGCRGNAPGWYDPPFWGTCGDSDNGCGSQGNAHAYCDGCNWDTRYDPFRAWNYAGTGPGHKCISTSPSICTPGQRGCVNGDIYECAADSCGTFLVQDCQASGTTFIPPPLYGCSNGRSTANPDTTFYGFVDLSNQNYSRGQQYQGNICTYPGGVPTCTPDPSIQLDITTVNNCNALDNVYCQTADIAEWRNYYCDAAYGTPGQDAAPCSYNIPPGYAHNCDFDFNTGVRVDGTWCTSISNLQTRNGRCNAGSLTEFCRTDITNFDCSTWDGYPGQYQCSGQSIQSRYNDWICGGAPGTAACQLTQTWNTIGGCSGAENSRCSNGFNVCQNMCSNGVDDDGDGLNDAQDPDCCNGATHQVCGGVCTPRCHGWSGDADACNGCSPAGNLWATCSGITTGWARDWDNSGPVNIEITLDAAPGQPGAVPLGTYPADDYQAWICAYPEVGCNNGLTYTWTPAQAATIGYGVSRNIYARIIGETSSGSNDGVNAAATIYNPANVANGPIGPCASPCTAEVCGDGIDQDCDGECSYDNQLCPAATTGDNDCPVGVTAIEVSTTNTCSGTNIQVNCTSTQTGVNSIDATLGGRACTFLNWASGGRAVFQCTAAPTATTETARCYVMTSRSFAITGQEQRTTTITTTTGGSCCSGYGAQGTCEADATCDWCPSCQTNMYTGAPTNRCVATGTCTGACTTGQCGATCDSGLGCADVTQCASPGANYSQFKPGASACQTGTTCGCDYTSILWVNQSCQAGVCSATCSAGTNQSCIASGGYPGIQFCTTTCGWGACNALGSCGDGILQGTETCEVGMPACQAAGISCNLITCQYGPAPAEVCNNNADDDCDTFIDGLDNQCPEGSGNDTSSLYRGCTDGIDNNLNGVTDSNDPGCCDQCLAASHTFDVRLFGTDALGGSCGATSIPAAGWSTSGQWCCGNQPNEFFITTSGRNGCCDSATACVDSGNVCREGHEDNSTLCNDGIDNDCDGNIDIGDSNCQATLTGYVFNGDIGGGAIVQGATVLATPPTQAQQSAVTGPTGIYNIANVPLGTYNAMARSAGFIDDIRNITLVPGVNNYNFTLLTGQNCNAACTDSSGICVRACNGITTTGGTCNFVDDACDQRPVGYLISRTNGTHVSEITCCRGPINVYPAIKPNITSASQDLYDQVTPVKINGRTFLMHILLWNQ